MDSRACAPGACKKVRDNSAGQTEHVVCKVSHDGAPKKVFLEKGDQLTAVSIWNY